MPRTNFITFIVDSRTQVHSGEYGYNSVYPDGQETPATSFSDAF